MNVSKNFLSILFLPILFLSFFPYKCYSAVIPQAGWSLYYVDSEELVGEDGAAVNSFDGNVNTIWHTEWYASPHPHEIQIDLGGVYDIDGFMYLPRQDGGVNGRIAQYEFYISTDGSDWGTAVATGTFANDASEKEVTFSPVTGQFIRLRALSEVNGNPWTSMAELNLLGEVSTENQPPTANDDTSSTNEDTAVTIDVVSNDTDIDGTIDVSTVSIVTDAGNGTTVVNGDGTITYTPVFGFTGTDIFTYTVNDNEGATSNEATVTITVSAGINQSPTANDDTSSTNEDTAVTIDVVSNDTDIDGTIDVSTVSIVTDAGNGTTVVNGDGTITYTPIFGFTGTDIFTYTVNDNEGATSNEATVTITVSAGINQPPNGAIDTPTGDVTITVGESIDFSGTGIDPDDDYPLSFLWEFGVGSGILDSTDEDPGLKQFDNVGTFTVTFTTTDAEGLSDPTPATRIITVQSGAVIPQTSWSLYYVDSEELVGEDGAAVNSFDGNVNTIWHTEWYASPHPHEIQIDLGGVYDIDGFMYLPRQDGGVNGRIAQYEFYISTDGSDWGTAVATGTFANDASEKEVTFSPVTGQFIRLRALSEVNGNPWTSMAELNLLGEVSTENQPPNGVINTPVSDVTITVGQSVDFSGTGIDPDGDYPLSFLWEFGEGSGILDSTDEDPGLKQFDNVGTFTVTFTTTDAEGLSDPTPATRIITVQSGAVIPQTSWSLYYVDSEELVGEDGAAVNSFDGNVNTFWHTEWYASPHPHEIQIDLGGVYDIDGFMYLPRQDGGVNGRIAQYEFYISTDGSDWGTAVATGTFANDAIEKEVTLSPVTGQFIRLRALSEVNGNPWTSMAELNLLASCVVPSVVILEPESNHLQTSPDLYVLVNACLATGQGVKILLDGGLQGIEDYLSPYETTFEDVSLSEHTVDAFAIDENGEEVPGTWTHYQVWNVGIGDYYVAMGDSITDGCGDDNASDDISNDGRNSGGGYEPILNNLLTAALSYPHNIINEGVGGAVSLDGAFSIQAIIEKHPEAQHFLVQYGTNDARPFFPVPSGLGLEPGEDGYPGSFKDNMQQIINAINADGRETCLAKAPIALGDLWDSEPYPDPDIGQKNMLIKEYNEVVDELVSDPSNQIEIIPPDFYSYFNYYDSTTGSYLYETEYIDNLHPNGAGYRSMAEQWFEALITP